MKTKIAWILAILLCLSVFALTACGGADTSAETEVPSETEVQTEAPSELEEPVIGQIAGGWTVSSEPAAPSIPEEAKEAFDKAVAELAGVGYEPIAYLGSQVVAGVNYGFLCRATVVSPDAEPSLCTLKVYCDLEGNATIQDIKDIAISDYTASGDVSFNPADLAGGWALPEDPEPAALPEDVQTAFDTALEGFAGVGYQPLAYLGSQVVAGANYAILCNATSVTAEPQSALAVVTIYADLEGGAQITSVSGFDFP